MSTRPIVSSGLLLGVGMGGFADGIVLHQILQVHNMLSAVYPRDTLVNAAVNMFWDGLFHAFTWVVTAAGIARLWKAGAARDVVWSAGRRGGRCWWAGASSTWWKGRSTITAWASTTWWSGWGCPHTTGHSWPLVAWLWCWSAGRSSEVRARGRALPSRAPSAGGR
jgi:hypothetical protein